MRPRRPAFNRIETSGNLEAPLRIAESVSCPHLGRNAPFTRNSHDIREFGERSPNWGGCVKYETARFRGQSHRIFRISRDSSENIRIPHGPIAAGLRRLHGIFLIRLNSTKTAPTWGGSVQYETPPGPWSVALDLQGISILPREPHYPPQGPMAVGLRRLRRFPLNRLYSKKTYPTWGGWVKYKSPHDPWPIA